MTPGPEHVLVKPDPDKKQEQTKSGIIIETDYKKRSEMEVVLKWGEVVAVGQNVMFPLKPGHRIAYNPFDSYRVEQKGEHKWDIVKAVGIHCYE